MTFTEPTWLLLLIPLTFAMLRWRAGTLALAVLRGLTLLLVVLAMAGLAVRLASRSGVVVVIADRSASMPPQKDSLQRETIGLIAARKPAESRLGVVAFADGSAVELSPEGSRFTDFQSQLGKDRSDLGEGLDAALALVPKGYPGRIVVLSDGRWTGSDPAVAALRAAERGIAIDYKHLTRGAASDLAIERIDAPGSVAPLESFIVTAWIRSPIEQEVPIELLRNRAVVAGGRQRLMSGSNRIVFRDQASNGGVLNYEVRVASGTDAQRPDPVPENNRARFLVGVSGTRPVLVVSGSSQSRLTSLLRAGGVDAVNPATRALTLEDLAGHAAVVLDNVPSQDLGPAAMQSIASWVTESGGALVMTGGEGSFGPGGYFQSPIEPILPVSMELRREHRKLNLSLVIALDRSGSMAVPTSDGRTKMELANLAAAQVLDLLGPRDELGVVAVDSSSHIVADLDPIEGRGDLRSRILSIESMGGGIFVYEALATAANMLLTARSTTRHIILFADAADAEEPGMYQDLLAKCRTANISVSVIGLGSEGDVDAQLLRDIAQRGGGRCFFTADARELPRLFAQDTFIVARSAFVAEPTAVETTGSLISVTGQSFREMPAIGGYNLCYLRDGAAPAVLTRDENRAPVVAAWQAGLGRVVAYTGEVDGRHTGAIAGWSHVGNFHTSLVRWAAGAQTSLPDTMLLTQNIEGGTVHLTLQLDPERTGNPISQLPRVTTLSAAGGVAPAVNRTTLQWRTPDELFADVPLSDAVSLNTVDVPGVGRVTLPPVCLPYSPEVAPAEEGSGLRSLQQLARMTGGRERIAAGEVWRDVPRMPRHLPLRTWLLLAALLTFLFEVAERRMRLLSAVSLPHVEMPRLGKPVRSRVKPVKPMPQVLPDAKEEQPSAEPPPTEAEAKPEPGLADALKRARNRAKRRV